MSPLFLFALVKCEIVTGFVIENRKQVLCIKFDKTFKDIKRSFLLKKQKKTGEFLQDKKMTKHTRYIQNEDEFLEFRKKKSQIEKMKADASESGTYINEDDEEIENKEFDEIFVDLDGIKKNPEIVYGICVELIKNEDKVASIYSRPFTFSENENQWILSDLSEEKSNSKYWTYAAIGVACPMDKYKPVTVIFSKIDIIDLSKLHISLLILLKSELNMLDRLKVYISTVNNVLLDVNPHIEIPIKLEDFKLMMDYVLSKMKIKDDKGAVLLSVVKNNINQYLPPNTYKLRLDVRGVKFEKELYEDQCIALFYNLDEEDDMESIRLTDFKMDTIGITGKIIALF